MAGAGIIVMMSSFNSRTPGGVRPSQARKVSRAVGVSIHAPREGCDPFTFFTWMSSGMFQFTHPGRGATDVGQAIFDQLKFQFTHPGRGATPTAE